MAKKYFCPSCNTRLKTITYRDYEKLPKTRNKLSKSREIRITIYDNYYCPEESIFYSDNESMIESKIHKLPQMPKK